jgi:hypothetical protein
MSREKSLVIAIKLEAVSVFRAVTIFLFYIIQSVTERYGQTSGTSSTYQNKKKYPYETVSGNI